MKLFVVLLGLLGVSRATYCITADNPKKFDPTWESLDSRPLPSWYDQAKIGIFIHWGVFSVPSFGSEWFWMNWKGLSPSYVQFVKRTQNPGFTYQEYAKDFTAEFFNANDWAKLFKQAGANYVVLTSKHHEGYTLWPSKYSYSWNSGDIGPRRDLIAPCIKPMWNQKLVWQKVLHPHSTFWHTKEQELDIELCLLLNNKLKQGCRTFYHTTEWFAKHEYTNNANIANFGCSTFWHTADDIFGELGNAVRKAGMRFGLYHSLYEWFNPMYLDDKRTLFKQSTFVDHKIIPEMKELIEVYKPEVLWSDGDWEADDNYWQSREFLAWLYNESPVNRTIVVNDRWGIDIPCKHGDFYTCQDRFNPGTLQKHKWENAMTVDKKSWGFRRNAKIEDYLTTHELITTLIQTISCGGNILINVGPTKEGIITPIFQERLKDLGSWLTVNGEAIYNSKPWTFQNDTISKTWYTAKGNNVYATTLFWPEENILKLGSVNKIMSPETEVLMLGYDNKLKWDISGDVVFIRFPDKSQLKSDWAWVIKFVVPNL